ncbi:dolichol phosphate-mannose biosynthesis regulatory protein [Hippocampus zosterae]|uniref:dolichol phosphate-mannose biosynthesis regulatory protein n=1 Tax=Hippocampus zosterae TaxID=109293 RepID=UPI00223E598E|nr:dolichol phosphate-mannose biosynthesis regulatory protein [Hippocampus zosterae]
MAGNWATVYCTADSLSRFFTVLSNIAGALSIGQRRAADISNRIPAARFTKQKKTTRKRLKIIPVRKMATGVDQAAGMSLIVFSLMLFTYYSIWVIVLPFVDSDHVLHKYFLPREYAVILPGIAAVLLLLCIGAFTAVILWKNQKPKKVN